MGAYLQRIVRLKCQSCHLHATVQLFNTFNSLVGSYCTRHGNDRLRELEQNDRALRSRGIVNDGRVR